MREVRLHDTLTGGLRPLEPREGRKVGVYACGPTVYGRLHVGNARPFVLFALLKRLLEHEGYEVTLVENVTDVNDKIYAAARARGMASTELAREMTDLYVADTDRLELGRPDFEPKASETIGPIIDLIEALIDHGHAYASDGDVYFRVHSLADYGKLSSRALEDMIQGEDEAEVAVKEHAHDFALWKAQKPEEDTAWDSPWGMGRPGWHIECSAMAEQILGLDFEIHGGGSDLVFPHHENEIAQTEAARGAPLARIWMHNGMVQFEEDKMSKSAGNIRLLDGAIEESGRDALVMFLVSGHYRSPLGFSPDALDEAARSVGRIREFCRRLHPSGEAPEGLETHWRRFFDALADDFETPAALRELFNWIAEGNRRLDAGERFGPGRLREMLWTIGMEGLLEAAYDSPDPEAEQLLAERESARLARDFAAADALRDRLAALGWETRDTSEGARLVRKG